MNPAEEREFVAANMDSDLQFILGDSGVALTNMVAIARRYGSLRRFNALGDDRAAIRTACLHDFAIPQDTPDNRAGGYYPPLFVLGGFRSQKRSKKNIFLEKSLRRNAVNSSVFGICGLLPWKVYSLNSLVFTVFRACVFTKHCK